MRMVSNRPTRKHAKEAANGILPVRASPAATPIMFCSAMPRLNARSGNFFAKAAVMVDFDRSASRVTMRGSLAPSSTSASPNAAREALAAMALLLLLLERGELVHDRARRRVIGEVFVPGGFGH